MPIFIDGNGAGRKFDGVGAVFSNGMTKLLMDYPIEQQRDILNLLFKENFGASLQHLKVEIGSDVNSSCGTEPSHMRSREDLNIHRGAGLWLAKLAKEINPALTLEALRWGTPAWILNDDDKYLYYVNFLKEAQKEFGITFDYLGCDQNEGAFCRNWVVQTLRPNLIRDGFGELKLVAADSNLGWRIAEDVLADQELKEALDVLNSHYVDNSSDAAVETEMTLWAGEHLASVRHSYVTGTVGMAKHILSMYPAGKMTMYEMHPALEANYPSTPFNYKGIIAASWPWSGHYEVTSGLWATAHFTQFIKPGWQYLDSACFSDHTGGYVTLKAPDNKNWSMILVNDSAACQSYDFAVSGGLMEGSLAYWKTTQTDFFVKQPDIVLDGGLFSIVVEPYSICSLTTTTGQQKGKSAFLNCGAQDMLLPYFDNFSAYEAGGQPVYMSDQGGAFEIAVDGDSKRKVLHQKITNSNKPIDWSTEAHRSLIRYWEAICGKIIVCRWI